MSQRMIELLHRTRIVAILRLDDLTDAEPIVRSLLAGGIRFIEFTLTNPQASAKVALLRREIV